MSYFIQPPPPEPWEASMFVELSASPGVWAALQREGKDMHCSTLEPCMSSYLNGVESPVMLLTGYSNWPVDGVRSV